MSRFTALAQGNSNKGGYDFPIVPVLEYFGFDNLDPEEHGWKQTLCAFHGERNPSSSYRTDTNYFHCFSCEAKGDAIQLLMDQEGLDFKDAVSLAEDLTGAEGTTSTKMALKPVRISGTAEARRLLGT